jgi:hypothetical protein
MVGVISLIDAVLEVADASFAQNFLPKSENGETEDVNPGMGRKKS